MKPILVSDAMRKYRLTYEQAVLFPRIADCRRAWLDEEQVEQHVTAGKLFLCSERAEILQVIRVTPPGIRRNASVQEIADFLGFTLGFANSSVAMLKVAGLIRRLRPYHRGLTAVTIERPKSAPGFCE